MTTLVINKNVNKTISQMEATLPLLKGREKEEMEHKLNLALSYRERKGLDLKMIEVKKKYTKGSKRYVNRMRELVLNIKGISFDKKSNSFVVRITINKVQQRLGAFTKPSEAVEILKNALN